MADTDEDAEMSILMQRMDSQSCTIFGMLGPPKWAQRVGKRRYLNAIMENALPANALICL